MKKNLFTILLSSFLISHAFAQAVPETDSLKEYNLEQIIVSANKFSENKAEVAQKIHVITAPRIAFQNTQTVPDLLAQSGVVMVQKSQAGGGSPMLRGFEASRVLLVIDGVRMNNLIYRAGHLQNAMTVDQNVLDRAEVLYGPASTVYGSDALGGVIHFQTKNPLLATEGSMLFKGNAMARYSTANQEKTTHVDFNLGWKKFGSLTSFTYSDFGDVRMGTKPQTLDTLWGVRTYYQTRINGRDTAVLNDDPYVQKFSGYKQYDALQKFLYRPSKRVQMVLNLQFSTTSDLPRYDRLTDRSATTRLAQAEWYYGPQKRLLGAYELTIDDLGFFDKGRLNVNYQDVEESRYTRGWQSANRTGRVEQVKVYGANLDFARKRGNQDLYVGLDFQTSAVKSTASAVNVNTGAVRTASTRYPDGDNTMTTVAAYLSHTWRLRENLILNDGFRLQSTNLRSTFVSTEFYKFPYREAKQDNLGWSGNLGLIYNAAKFLRLSALASTGFRVPNVDDLTKVFDSNTGSKIVVVPNPDIQPEKTYNLDLSATLNLFDGRLTWDNTLFFTRFDDAIALENFQFNGQDSILYDGVRSRVRANVNAQKANLWGFTSVLKAQITEGFSAMASYNYTYGRLTQSDGKEVPLDHVPPTYGTVSAKYQFKKFQTELFVNYSGWKRIADYRLGAEDNEQYATKDGMPSWWTLNFRAGYNVGKGFAVQAGVENILDVQYRVFASGIHQPGRNLYATLRYAF